MPFIQIIEFTTDDIDSVQRVDQDWMEQTAGTSTARRQIVVRDRKQPNRYMAIVFFDSYESAMQNSELPETAALAERYEALTESITFHDLDVIADAALR